MNGEKQKKPSKSLKLLTEEQIASIRDHVDVRALNSRQIQAAEILASGLGYYETARVMEIHHSTLARWQKKPQFQEYVESVRETLVESCLYRLPALYSLALDTVERIMREGGAKNAIKAASLLLRPMAG